LARVVNNLRRTRLVIRTSVRYSGEGGEKLSKEGIDRIRQAHQREKETLDDIIKREI
jgi:hypothetical protein